MLNQQTSVPYGEQRLYLGSERGPSVKVGELARALALKLREPAQLHVGHFLLAELVLRYEGHSGARSGAQHLSEDMDRLCGKARQWQSQQAHLGLLGAAACDLKAELEHDVRQLIAGELAAGNPSFAERAQNVRATLTAIGKDMDIGAQRLQQVGTLLEQAALQMAHGALAWKGAYVPAMPADDSRTANATHKPDGRLTPYANVLIAAARHFKEVMPAQIDVGSTTINRA